MTNYVELTPLAAGEGPTFWLVLWIHDRKTPNKTQWSPALVYFLLRFLYPRGLRLLTVATIFKAWQAGQVVGLLKTTSQKFDSCAEKLLFIS